MEPELIAVAVTSGVAAFAGVIKSLNGFNEKNPEKIQQTTE
jgi:hypothetical protein